MSQALATRTVNIGDYNLSVTTRDCGDDPHIMEELTFRTIAAWLYIVSLLEKGTVELDAASVEQRFATEHAIEFQESWAEPRVTVWDSYRGVKNPSFHLSSSDIPQVAINMWLANKRAIDRAIEKYGQKPPLPAPNSSATPSNGQTTPKALDGAGAAQSAAFSRALPDPLSQGVIRATRAPNPNAPQYADGQMVEFTINRVVLGVHPTSGSVIYSLWSPLGKKYAIKTVYRTAANSDEDSYDYAAIAPLLESLKLAIPGNVQAEGKWRLVMRVSHVEQKDKTVKEYLNVQSMEGVEVLS